MIKNQDIIAEAIRKAMNEQNIGINELSKACKMSKNSLYKVLRSENYESRVLINILDFLNLKIEISSN